MEVLEPAKTMDSILKAVKEEVKKETRYSKQVKLFSLCFLKKALEGIRVLHNQRWVHTDVHDGNFMLKNDMTVKFIDFGQARRLTASDPLRSRISRRNS